MNKQILTAAAAALLTGFYSSWNQASAAELGDAKGVLEEARQRGAQYGPGILISAARPGRASMPQGPASMGEVLPPFPVDATISIQDPQDPSSWKWPGRAKQSGLQSTQRCFRSQSVGLAAALKSPAVRVAAKSASPGVSKLHVWFYYTSDPQSGPDAIRPTSVAVDWIFDNRAVKRTVYKAGKYGVETKDLKGRLVGSSGVYQFSEYSGPGSDDAEADGGILCRVSPDMIAGPLN
ncbi:MAG: hypothetical protein ABII00_12705 [Elusimicrobiota bacterium]